MSPVPTGLPLWVPVGKERIYVKTPFALKDVCKHELGGHWDPVDKAWHFPATPEMAKRIREALVGWPLQPDASVLGLLREAEFADVAQQSKDAGDDELAAIPGRLPAWLHQKRAYHFAQPRRSAMLAMDMGTGKSRTSISLLDGWDTNIVVILCPRSVMAVWPNQFNVHSAEGWIGLAPPLGMTVEKRTRYLRRETLRAASRGEQVAVICNYEAAWRPPMKEFLLALADDGASVILDECHRIKAPDGKQSKFCALLCEHARKASGRILGLTGTPMPHSPLDVYAQYRAIDPGIFGTSWARFRARYAIMAPIPGAAGAQKVVGFQNQEELAAKFALASFVVKKSEAGLDLPPVVHTERRFDLEARSLKAYQTIEAGFILGVEDGTVTAQNALVELLRLQQITSGYVKDDEGIERQIGTEKLDVLADVLDDFSTGEPVVIFARFKHDLDAIANLCRKQGRRVGVVSGAVKAGHPDYGLNEHSQMRDDIDVIVLQLQSGGVGIDLTRSCTAIYYSLDFSLGNFDQTLARLDRPGQKRSVTYIHLIADGTTDDVVYAALRERRAVVDSVIEASRRRKAA